MGYFALFRATLKLFGCTCFLATSGFAAQDLTTNRSWDFQKDLSEITEVLDLWLDANSTYQRSAHQVQIEFLDPGDRASMELLSKNPAFLTRGLYEPTSATIFLVRPWFPDRLEDVSVLLHELVHHRQHMARHWYCPGAQEPDAYALQQAWLSEYGASLRINRIAIVLEAGCTPRDIHPPRIED